MVEAEGWYDVSGRLGESAGAFGADPVPARHERGIARPLEADGALGAAGHRPLARKAGEAERAAQLLLLLLQPLHHHLTHCILYIHQAQKHRLSML